MTNKEKKIQQWKELLEAFTTLKDSLLRLQKNWPQIRKEIAEAEKNRPERDPIMDVW